jgi:hypothetical protein
MSIGRPGHNLIAAILVANLGDDSGIVAAGREDVRHLRVGQKMDLVGRAPWRDVVLRSRRTGVLTRFESEPQTA